MLNRYPIDLENSSQSQCPFSNSLGFNYFVAFINFAFHFADFAIGDGELDLSQNFSPQKYLCLQLFFK